MSSPPPASATTASGLTTVEARHLLSQYGPNEIAAKKKSALKKFIAWFVAPIPLMLVAAAALSYFTGKDGDAYLILVLLVANYFIQVWHEHKADQAVEKLEEHLAATALALRDGTWVKLPAREIVPGDRIALRVGARISADARLVSATALSVNESMLTGESLPKEKSVGDTVYSAAIVTAGSAEAVVTNTGNHTYFGAAVQTLELAKKRSALEEDVLAISKLLAGLALISVVILSVVLYLKGTSLTDLATLDISLLIAGIPVALPTVMSLIISAGVLSLAKGGAAVRRLSSLEDLANVNLLLSDKTGTLTENKIRVSSLLPFGSWSDRDALALAAAATDQVVANPLEEAVRTAARTAGANDVRQVSLLTADSVRKRTTANIAWHGQDAVVSLGATATVAALCRFTNDDLARFEKAVKEGAARGDRALLLAFSRGTKEEAMEPVAVVFLADTLRADAAETVRSMSAAGIRVEMLTGDDIHIARDIAGMLRLPGEMYPRTVFDDPKELAAALPVAAGFAGVLPADKYAAVEAAKKTYRVAVTGDGANDLPSVSDADVGIAVANSVDALRDTADMVLLSDGLSVIATAIREARKVFMRLYHYSLYRISESARLIITILVIGLLFQAYPLTPIQVLLLAFLNDVPIVTFAFDRVKVPKAPANIDARRRAVLSFAYGTAGILNSLLLLWFAATILHLPWAWVQTIFFLKLVVSGHMLVYVAHTEQRWFRYLPSWQVIAAVSFTQVLASLWAFYGFFTAAVPFWLIAFVWLWSFFWMQMSELFKMAVFKLFGHVGEPPRTWREVLSAV